MKIKKVHVILLAVSSFMALLSILFHFSGLPDRMTTFENLEKVVQYHETQLSFKHRIITTNLIYFISRISSLSIGKSFVVVQFTFLLISSYLVGLISFFLNEKITLSVINVVCFYSSFSILFIFFSPIYTYDEPLQYVFILMSMLFLIKGQLFWFVLFFTISMIIKETSAIILPGFYVINTFFNKKNKPSTLVVFLAPLVFYWIYLIVNKTSTSDLEINERLSLITYNFQNMQYTIESIMSFLLVCSLSLYLLLRPHYFLSRGLGLVMKKAFLITLITNSIIVFGMAYARESRLFALPLFFTWPIMFELLFGSRFEWKFNLDLRTLSRFFIVIFVGVFTYYLTVQVYIPVKGSGVNRGFHLYFALLVSYIVFDMFFIRLKTNKA